MKGLYFNNDGEPDEFVNDFLKDLYKIMEDEEKEYVRIEFEDVEDYYNVMNHVNDFMKENISVYGVLRDGPEIIFAREPDMIAEHEAGEVETEVVEEIDNGEDGE